MGAVGFREGSGNSPENKQVNDVKKTPEQMKKSEQEPKKEVPANKSEVKKAEKVQEPKKEVPVNKNEVKKAEKVQEPKKEIPVNKSETKTAEVKKTEQNKEKKSVEQGKVKEDKTNRTPEKREESLGKKPETKTVETKKAEQNKEQKSVEQAKVKEDNTNKNLEKEKREESLGKKPEIKKAEEDKEKKLDEQYASLMERYYKATKEDRTFEEKKATFNADYEEEARNTKAELDKSLKDVESQMSKFDPEKMSMDDAKEWSKLNGKKHELEEQISGINDMLDTAKEFQRNTALEESFDRINAYRGDKKAEQKRDLEKDQECVRYNFATMRGLREDLKDATKEMNDVKAQISDFVNTYTPEELQGNKQYEALHKKYNELSDKVDTYESQINTLNNFNQRLAEINGVDKKGEPKLDIKNQELQVGDKDITDAIAAVKDSSLVGLSKEKLEPKDCIKALESIQRAEREVIPALAEQVSELQQKISSVESYIKNNPLDDSMKSYKDNLEKELAPKLSQMNDLVESVTYLKTDMQLDGSQRSVKCLINADGTYTLHQRWTNVNEKVKDNGFYKNTRQFYANAYDRVSNCVFDEKGNAISRDFSYKYKLMGYYSDRKIGNEKINIHNVFETGLLNVNAKGGWNQKEGFNVEGRANVFEIRDTATLNMLNKQMMQLNANLSYMEAKGDIKFKEGDLKASFSVNDGWTAGADLSVGKVKILEGAVNSWSNSIEGKFDLAQVAEGKFGKLEVSGENNLTHSYAVGDSIKLFEYKNENGSVEHAAFVSDVAKLVDMDAGFSDIKSVYDTYKEQKETMDDISQNGILKDETSYEEKVAFQSKQHADEDGKFNREKRDGKDLGERAFNGAANSENPIWVKEADVLKAMDKSLLSLDDQKLVSEVVDKIQKGESLTKGDAEQLEYIHMHLAANDYGAEARAVSHLYDKSGVAVRDNAENVFLGAKIEGKEADNQAEKVKVAEDGKKFLNISQETGKEDWVSQDEINLAMKKSYLASDDMALVDETVDKVKSGEKILDADKEQLSDISEILIDNGYYKEASAIVGLLEATEKNFNDIETSEQRSEISSELKNSLAFFEQSKWDKMSLEERKLVASELAGKIVDELGVENRPEVKFYNNPDVTDFGGFSEDENVIYLNEYNMSDAKGTADTIAHESRHCWQHEYVKKSDSLVAQEFRENFEHYRRPERNYEAYRNQPIERDAREYANAIVNNIPKETFENGVVVELPTEAKTQSYKELNKEKGAVFDKPDGLVSKIDMTVAANKVAGAESPAKQYNDILRESVYSDKRFSSEGRVKEGLDLFHSLPKGKRTDINPVNNSKAIKTDEASLKDGIEKGYLPIAWHEYHGLDENKPITGVIDANGQFVMPDTLYRRGADYGNNLTCKNEDGSIPTTNETAVPYEDNPEAMHEYKVDADAYKKVVDCISGVDEGNQKDLERRVSDMNNLIDEMNKKHGTNERHIDTDYLVEQKEAYDKFQGAKDSKLCSDSKWNADTTYGLAGTVAPMHVDNDPLKEKLYDGGAKQFNTPVAIRVFIRTGAIWEEK